MLNSAGPTRSLDERVERFLDKFAGHHYIIDAQELGLDQLDDEIAEYFNSILLHPITKQFIAGLEM